MEHDGESGDHFLDLVEDVQTDLGIIAGLEFVGAMGGTDSDGKRIHAGTFHEFIDLFGTGVGVFFSFDIIFHTGENAQLTFDGDVELVGIFHDLAGLSDIFFEREVRTVDHNGAETEVDAALAGLEVRTMIQVQNDRNTLTAGKFLGILNSTLSHIAEQSLVGIVTGTLGNLKDHRGLCLNASLNDSLQLFHVVEVVCGDGIAAVNSATEKFAGVDQSESFVTDHSENLLN